MTESKTKSKHGRLTVYVDPDLLDRCRNLVYFYPGLTLSGLVEIALSTAVQGFEKKYKKEFGREVSIRPGPLLPGKPSQ